MHHAPSVAETLADTLTPEDVEREFQIKRGTQGAMRSRRQIPFFRLGGGKLIRYSRRALTEWLAGKCVAVAK